jgi:glucose-1-phosphate thymidylyltransferase
LAVSLPSFLIRPNHAAVVKWIQLTGNINQDDNVSGEVVPMSSNYKIIIPMAGWGSRMRPLTWSRPKPLLPLAGRTVLDYSLRQFDTLPGLEHAEYVFIISTNQGDLLQKYMQEMHPEKTVHFVVQQEMRGQAEALWQAREFLEGQVLIAFSDTLIETDLSFLPSEPLDAVAWVKPIDDPRRFGVIEVDDQETATRLIEKPTSLDNNMVVVGFYYFKEARLLLEAIVEQMKRGKSLRGEYFLIDAINIYIERGGRMRRELVSTWLDAGIPSAVLETNRYLLEKGLPGGDQAEQPAGVAILPPVYIAPGARVESSVIGPYVSIGKEASLKNVVISNSIIDARAVIENKVIEGSLIGCDVTLTGHFARVNLGDNTQVME